MSFPYEVGLSYGMEKTTYSDGDQPGFRLGTRAALPDGRTFRFAQANGAIGAGKLVMQSQPESNNDQAKDVAVASAAAVGDTSIDLTLNTSNDEDLTENQYADGYVYVNDEAGEGHLYRIHTGTPSKKAHPAVDVSADASVTINLHPDDSIAEALTTSSQVGLMQNPYKDVELWDASDIDGAPLGVAPTEVADNEYFWLQDGGLATVLADGAPTIGQHVRGSDAVDGAVEPLDRDGTAEDEAEVGIATLIAVADTEYQLVYLNIPGK